MAAWELQLTASAQPQEKGPYCTSVAQKRSEWKLQSPVSSECLSLAHHFKVEKWSSQTISSQGLFIQSSITWSNLNKLGFSHQKINLTWRFRLGNWMRPADLFCLLHSLPAKWFLLINYKHWKNQQITHSFFLKKKKIWISGFSWKNQKIWPPGPAYLYSNHCLTLTSIFPLEKK